MRTNGRNELSHYPLALCLAVLLAGCRSPDPKAVLELGELETYWAIDSAQGQTEYIAPVARFRLSNTSTQPLRSVQATAVFRRKGEEDQSWGAGFEQVASSGRPLAPGQSLLVVLKSDGRYYSTGAAESMFRHADFKDARVEIFMRVGSSGPVKMGEAEVERRIGARGVQPPPA